MVFIETKRRMLVIDDDEAILRMFKRILERNGYEVATAQTGEEAEGKLAHSNFDATLIDLRLPDMNGVDLLPLIKRTHPNMIKIVITGVPSSDNASQAAQKGADIFLAKPVQPEVLLNVLDIKFQEKRMHNYVCPGQIVA